LLRSHPITRKRLVTLSSLFISAYDVESPESFLIELAEDKALGILAQFNNDYEKLADSLGVQNKKLMLMNPVNSFLAFRTLTKQLSTLSKEENQLLRYSQAE